LLLVGKFYNLIRRLMDCRENMGGGSALKPRLFKITISLMKSIEANEVGQIPMTILRLNEKHNLS
jgi:hypothetical protein